MFRIVLTAVLLAACWTPAAAVSVDELVQAVVEEIPEDELLAPGSTALPERLADLLDEDFGLDAGQRRELQMRVAEAWLGARLPERAEQLFAAVLADGADEPLRRRVGMGLIAAWELRLELIEDPVELPAAPVALERHGEFPASVRARAHIVEAERLMDDQAEAAITELDRALVLLATADVRERVPVYALRIIAMERAGQEGDAIQDWLVAQGDDPAVAHVLASLLTAGQKLIGREAPALRLPRLDQDGEVDLGRLRGKPVLLYFFATWCKPCAEVSRAVAGIAGARDELEVIGISLDNRDTIKHLADYRTRYGIAFPLAGELQGWDGEIDDQFHVEAIPHLVLIGRDGRIRATELVGADAEETALRVRKALDSLRPAAAAGGNPDGVAIP